MTEVLAFGSDEIEKAVLSNIAMGVDSAFDFKVVAEAREYLAGESEIIQPIQPFEIHKDRMVRNLGYQSMTLARRKTLGHIRRNRRI